MADVSITASSVVASASAKTSVGVAGATVTAGQPVYEDANDGHSLKPAQGNSATASKVVGIALHGASDGQPLKYIISGQLTAGGTLVLGQTYVASAAAAGGIAPISDLGSTHYPTILGIAITTGILAVNIQVGGVAKP